MKIIEPMVFVPQDEISPTKIKLIERYARVCYKSENSNMLFKNDDFIKNLIKSGHESVLEHEKATVLIVMDRGISHEIVRHRIASYSQESTRYCNYTEEKFNKEITFIRPYFYKKDMDDFKFWEQACKASELAYFNLLMNSKPEEARSILPNSLKTEIVITFNFREWRHFFKLRCSSKAHPQMRQLSIPLLLKFKQFLPQLFWDIPYDKGFLETNYAQVLLTDEFFNKPF